MDAPLHINQKGVTSGPYTLSQVREGLQAGRFSPHDLAWPEGATAWHSLRDVLAELDSQSEATEFSPSSNSHTGEEATEFAVKSDDGATEFTPSTDDGATEFTPPPPDDGPTEFVQSPERVPELSPTPTPAKSPTTFRRRLVPGDLVVQGQYKIVAEVQTDGREALTYQGQAIGDNALVFIKQLVEARRTQAEREKLAELRDRLMSIDNDYCLSYRDLEFGENHILQVFEYLEGYSDLRWLIKSDPAAIRPEADRLVRQLAQGVNYLHNLGIVHRDLKPGNVMVRRFPEGWKIKIVDYGTVSLVEGGQDGSHTTFAGTPRYAPPESQGRKFQERTPDLKKYDWWGVGRIIQEVLLGCTVSDLLGDGQFAEGSTSLEAHFEIIIREEKVEHYGCRAGMVELTEARIKGGLGKYRSLLRGLLTTSLEDRWGFAEIARWLKQPDNPPPDAYDKLPDRQASHLFPYKGRYYTLGEIARTLATADHWNEAQKFLFQGANVSTKEKSLLDFIRIDLGDKRMLRDLDELTSMPNPRKLQNRYLLPALEDYATGLAISRLAYGSTEPLPLHLRGLPVTRATLLKWSQSTVPEENDRVAILSHAPLIEAIKQVDSQFYGELAPVLAMLKRVQKLEEIVNGEPLSPQSLAQMFQLILIPKEELQTLVDKVKQKYRQSTIEILSPILTGKDAYPPEETVIYMAYSVLTDPGSFITHREFVAQEREEIFRQAEGLHNTYAWLTVSQTRNSHHPIYLDNLRIGLLCAWAVGQVALLAIIFFAVVHLLSPHRPSWDHRENGLDSLFFPYIAAYLIALFGVNWLIWHSIHGYMKAYVVGGGEETAFDAAILENIAQNKGRLKGRTKFEYAKDYENLQSRLTALQVDGPADRLPGLPEPHGLGPLFGLLTLLLFYIVAEPLIFVILGAGSVSADFAMLPLLLLPIAVLVAWLTGVFSYHHPRDQRDQRDAGPNKGNIVDAGPGNRRNTGPVK